MSSYGGSSGGSSGGGGTKDLYWAWRNKLTSKLYPGSGSGYSGGGGGGSYSSSGGSYSSGSYSTEPTGSVSEGGFYPPPPPPTPPMGPDPFLMVQAKTSQMDPRWAGAYNTVAAGPIFQAQQKNFRLENRQYNLLNRAYNSNHPETAYDRAYTKISKLNNRMVPPFQYVRRILF
jgi:hypothetical protein